MVKTVNFDNPKKVGNPSTTVKVYDAQGADEIIFLDIDASMECRDSFYEVIGRAAEETFVPFTAGGGVKTIDNIRQLLNRGADKVSINTASIENSNFIKKSSKLFGKQCIVVSIDVKFAEGNYKVFSHCGKKNTGLNPVDWAKRVEQLGAGEILLSSIDKDGTMTGYDIPLIKQVSEAVNIPVIANSGVGNLQQFADGLIKGGVNAVAAASIFHFTDQSIIKTKAFFKTAGITVRQT